MEDGLKLSFSPERLRKARKKRRQTQMQAAHEIGAGGPSVISDWERGIRPPSIKLGVVEDYITKALLNGTSE